jgi:hypothetical protein
MTDQTEIATADLENLTVEQLMAVIEARETNPDILYYLKKAKAKMLGKGEEEAQVGGANENITQRSKKTRDTELSFTSEDSEAADPESSVDEDGESFVLARTPNPKVRRPRHSIRFAPNDHEVVYDDYESKDLGERMIGENDPSAGSVRTILQTIAQDPPKCPKLSALDFLGFRKLEKDYNKYKLDCETMGIRPKTIDHCIVDLEQKPLREQFRIGMLGQRYQDPDVIDPKQVWDQIRKAVRVQMVGDEDACFLKLPAAIKNSYNMEIRDVESRIQVLVADVQRHLGKYHCDHLWELPGEGKQDDQKYKRAKIIKCMLEVLKPDDLKGYIKSQVSKSSKLKFNHLEVIKLIHKWARRFQSIYLAKRTSRSDTGNLLKKNRGYPHRIQNESVTAKLGQVHTTQKVRMYKKAKCLGCGEKGHYFLKSGAQGTFVQNCPIDVGSRYDSLYKQSLREIEKAKEKNKGYKQAKLEKKRTKEQKALVAAYHTIGKELKKVSGDVHWADLSDSDSDSDIDA